MERTSGRCRPRHHDGLPVLVRLGHRKCLSDLCEYLLDDGVEDRVLVGEVVVEGHRFDVERFAQTPHAESVESVRIQDLECRKDDLVPGERRATVLLVLGGHRVCSFRLE